MDRELDEHTREQEWEDEEQEWEDEEPEEKIDVLEFIHDMQSIFGKYERAIEARKKEVERKCRNS